MALDKVGLPGYTYDMENIAAKIKAHLAADKNNSVTIATMTRCTVIRQKDVDKFAKAGYELIKESSKGERGFYLQSGKSKLYVDPFGCKIIFG